MYGCEEIIISRNLCDELRVFLIRRCTYKFILCCQMRAHWVIELVETFGERPGAITFQVPTAGQQLN
jgi:hypothetical protein